GVAARRFDDDVLAWCDESGLFGFIDHADADAVFHAGMRIEAFEFRHDLSRQSSGEFVQAHERSASDGFGDVVIDVGHLQSFVSALDEPETKRPLKMSGREWKLWESYESTQPPGLQQAMTWGNFIRNRVLGTSARRQSGAVAVLDEPAELLAGGAGVDRLLRHRYGDVD